MLHLQCPMCQQPLSIPDEYAGQSGRCNYCGAALRVPAAMDSPLADSALAGPYASPRRPVRPGAGMIANEAEHEGGAGASLGRIAVLGCLALVVVASILPAAVIGFSAETAPPPESRPRSIPAARGVAGSTPIVPAPPPSTHVDPPAPAVRQPEPEDLQRIVYATRTGARYHKSGCRHLGLGAIALTAGRARARGLSACQDCGG